MVNTNKIKAKMKELELTQSDVAKELGIRQSTANQKINNIRCFMLISPLYIVTNHTGFYECYDWEFLCMVQGDGEPNMIRMYIRR